MEFREWCAEREIVFKYTNSNPECTETHEGEYSRKFYFNVLLDDRSGFNFKKDWEVVYNTVRRCVLKELNAKKRKNREPCL